MPSENYMQMRSDQERYKYDQRKYGSIKVATKTDGEKSLEEKAKRKGNPEVRIDFDRQGRMWLSYVDADVGYVARRAVFHHWIRRELAKMGKDQSRNGYWFERKDGIGKTNKTAFCLMQQCWGLGREYYCPTMFEYEQKDFHTALYPRHKVRSLYWKNRLVIDYWLAPIQRFQTIPWVLSDQFEGGFLEMSMRLHPEVTFRTLRARMPPFFKRTRGSAYREIWDKNTLSNRARHFRERAGAISWAEYGVKDRVKEFLDSHVSQAGRVGNSTRACRDLTVEELKDLLVFGK